MMHSMFPIIPLATDPGDLRPVESLLCMIVLHILNPI